MRDNRLQDSITTGAGHYTPRNADSVNRNTNGGGGDPDSRYSSWDRRSQTSNGGHRYYSISSNTLGKEDPRGSPIPEDPPKILQYARPPENLTSPNRESTLLPTDHSLTHSPDLEKKVEKERRSLERRQQQQQQLTKVPRRGDTASAAPSAKSSVISSLRNSFRSRSRKTSAPVPLSSAPVSPSDGPPSIHLPTRKLSSSSAASASAGGRYTPTSRSGSVNSFRGNAGAGWSAAARNSTVAAATTAQLLPGRAASPGRPVQVVAPFIPEEGNPEEAGRSAEMRDPTLLQQHRLNTNNNHHPAMEGVQAAARTSVSAVGAAPTAPVRQQRCLPQTPKQASRTGLTSASAAAAGTSGGGRAAAKVSAVVSPVQHATASSSSAAPRPAQRLSLRHKVRERASEQTDSFVPRKGRGPIHDGLS